MSNFESHQRSQEAYQRMADYYLAMLMNDNLPQNTFYLEKVSIEVAIQRLESGKVNSKFSVEELRAKLKSKI